MPTSPRKSRVTHLLLTGILATMGTVLPACSDSAVTARDFNELIPRMMGALDKPSQSPDEAAANLFNVTNADERRDAIAYLQDQKYGHQPAYMKAYYLLSTDPSPMVRGQAMRALGTSHDPTALETILKGLDDKDPAVRRDAAAALRTTFGEVAIPTLCVRVRDDVDDQVRITSAEALQNASNLSAIRALIDALDDRNPAVVYWAHMSLVRVTRQGKIGYDGKDWLTWYQATFNGPSNAPAASQPAPVHVPSIQ